LYCNLESSMLRKNTIYIILAVQVDVSLTERNQISGTH
jgi:hypothetical protein